MSARHSYLKDKWHIGDSDYRRAALAFREAREELKHISDSIRPDEIPPSASFHDWMRNEREAYEFLYPHAWRKRRYRWKKSLPTYCF